MSRARHWNLSTSIRLLPALSTRGKTSERSSGDSVGGMERTVACDRTEGAADVGGSYSMGRIVFNPDTSMRRYNFVQTETISRFLSGLVGPQGVASPRGSRDTYETGHGEPYELPLSGTVRKAA
jgi:hypothetical protein